tara:strand:+ start:151 stop:615 length:465 start_codon:yes stop_codon:yes gene_type:complete
MTKVSKARQIIEKTREAREYLESRGFYTSNMWSEDDVQGKLEEMGYKRCNSELAQKILNDVFRNDATYDQIWLSMEYAIEYRAENPGMEEWERLEREPCKHIEEKESCDHTSFFDISYVEDEVSKCCNAQIYIDIDMCSKCKKYCKPTKTQDND